MMRPSSGQALLCSTLTTLLFASCALVGPPSSPSPEPLSDTARAWCLDHFWEVMGAADRLGILESGQDPATYASDLYGYEQTFGNNPDEERYYAGEWARNYPESYVPACQAALGPR